MNGERKLRIIRDVEMLEEESYYEDHVCGPECFPHCINGDPDTYDDPQG